MSTSDSDFSIDWLASDEDDNCDSTKSPEPSGGTPLPWSPSSSSPSSTSPSSSSAQAWSCTQSRPGGLLSGLQRRRGRRRRRRKSDHEDEALSPVQGLTPICASQTVSMETTPRSDPRTDTEDELFWHKCSELQCFIPPLTSILQGLRSGRYSERLSSFQESIAMDRIQRILGVLHNPNMGGRFLAILLKIEEMLQRWFPHIRANLSRDDGDGVDEDTPAKKQKHQQCCGSSFSPPSHLAAATMPSYSSTHLKWLHTSPICSLESPEPTPVRPGAAHREATQDNAVSSSTDCSLPSRWPSADPHLCAPPFQVSSPCLERLLLTKESIITPRADGGGGGAGSCVNGCGR